MIANSLHFLLQNILTSELRNLFTIADSYFQNIVTHFEMYCNSLHLLERNTTVVVAQRILRKCVFFSAADDAFAETSCKILSINVFF